MLLALLHRVGKLLSGFGFCSTNHFACDHFVSQEVHPLSQTDIDESLNSGGAGHLGKKDYCANKNCATCASRVFLGRSEALVGRRNISITPIMGLCARHLSVTA